MKIEDKIQTFVEEHHTETIGLLKTLAAIPAPSLKEQRRAEFICDWLRRQGAANAVIDGAGNVVFLYGRNGTEERRKKNLTVVAAHMDVVFPDMESLPLYERDGRLFAPGVGDNTANLVNMLMTVKFLLQYPAVSDRDLLFVADVGEEGLGNLKGSREIMKTYGERISEWISFDLYYDGLCDSAVGSQRYKIRVKTRGGHSYGDFGEKNAIAGMAEIIAELYRQVVPQEVKTTYNVGQISGGTSINAIAQEAVMSYEFRSESALCLGKMEESLKTILEKYRKRGLDIDMETLGIRPGKEGIDKEEQDRLVQTCLHTIRKFYDGTINIKAASTDSNIPLSCGIPAVTVGTVLGGLLHTREEWIDMESMKTGQKIAIGTVMQCL